MKNTINVTKQLRLDELIQHIYENEIANNVFIDTEEQFAVHSDSVGGVQLEVLKMMFSSRCVDKDVAFTVTAEEPIKETDSFANMAIVLPTDEVLTSLAYTSIKTTKDKYPKVKEIHAVIDGKLELIWERDTE